MTKPGMPPLITIDEALAIPAHRAREQHKKYINPGLTMQLKLINFDKDYVRAQGIYVWDRSGNQYLDFLGGYGSINLGHNPPQVLDAIEKVKERPNAVLEKAAASPILGALAENLARITPGDLQNTFFANSGAEATEGALKTARAFTGKATIVYCDNSYHGKTIGALSVTGRELHRKPFGALLPHCKKIPFGDAKALEEKLRKKDVAAFIVEPVQGEGGINVPRPGYLKETEELCQKYGSLLIVDEVQTGLGRTGKMFACEHENVKPDIMTLAKSLGGGVLPMGAFITTSRVWQKVYGGLEGAWLHTSTLGGSAPACAAAIATLTTLVEENLPEQAREKGDYFLAKLKILRDRYKMIKDVRGLGLMIGIEFYEPVKGLANKLTGSFINKLSKEFIASMVVSELINKYKIISGYALNNPNVIRFEPPLTVSVDQIDQLVDATDRICREHKGFLRIAAKTGRTAVRRISRDLLKSRSS
jgi:putrescine aminotransferase